MKDRAAGILLHITSLPSKYGIGCFSESAYDFVDWLKGAGQTYWQILPIGPTSYGDSPYQSFSTFAGNPYFIDLDLLVKDHLLEKKDLKDLEVKDSRYVDYGHLYETRYLLLHKAYEKGEELYAEEFKEFISKNKA